MKKLIAATTALTLLTATVAVADEPQTPNMSVEIVTQDMQDNAFSGDVLVPILTMIFLFLTLSGGSGSGYYPS